MVFETTKQNHIKEQIIQIHCIILIAISFKPLAIAGVYESQGVPKLHYRRSQKVLLTQYHIVLYWLFILHTGLHIPHSMYPYTINFQYCVCYIEWMNNAGK